MELKSLEIFDDGSEVVEVTIGGITMAQAHIMVDDQEFIIAKLHATGDQEQWTEAILNEYVENPPS